MNSRILVLTALLALPLSSATADEAVEAHSEKIDPQSAPKRLERPARFAQLELLLEAGRSEVALLNEQLLAAATPEARDALQKQIVAAKRSHRERFLMEHLLLAEESGDLKAAAEAQRQLDHLRNKNNGSQLTVERPVPSQGDNR